MPVTFSWNITSAPTDSTASSSNTSSTPGSDSGATALRDWALDPIDGDLALDGTNDALFNSGTDGIASDIEAALKTWLGSWFYDTSIGFPWLQDVLGQKYDASLFRRDIQTLVTARPGVVALSDYAGSFDNESRELDISFQVLCDTGQLIDATLQATPGGS